MSRVCADSRWMDALDPPHIPEQTSRKASVSEIGTDISVRPDNLHHTATRTHLGMLILRSRPKRTPPKPCLTSTS